MKKILVLSATAVALCLTTVSVSAGFVTPRVPPSANPDAAQLAADLAFAPNSLPVVRTVTNVRDTGAGSLRQAIASSASGDVINFSVKLPAIIALSSPLVIVQGLTVLGPDPTNLTVMRSTVKNTPSFRVFDVEAGVVTLAGMTIRNGSAFSGSNLHDNVGGGIFNRGLLTVSNCVITANSAPTTDWGTNVSPRESIGFGAGIFSDNGSQLALFNCTISTNQASAAGGGVCTYESASFFARGCTLSSNFAKLQGGGLNFQGHVGILQNCTIIGNTTTTNGAGSGIANVAFEAESPTTLTLTACTVTGNTGTPNGAFAIAGLNENLGLTNRLLSTLISANAGPGVSFFGTFTFESLGHNLDSDGTSGLVNGVNGDLVGTAASPINAKLSVLQTNGGPTLTVALLPGSPALGAAACSDANGAPLTVDQRGFPRPHVTGCDIGAFENQTPTLICPASQTLTYDGRTLPSASLVATVADADGDALSVVWSVNSIARQTNNVAATQPPKSQTVTFKSSYSLGTNIVTVWVSDSKAVPMACSTSVIVRPKKAVALQAVPNAL